MTVLLALVSGVLLGFQFPPSPFGWLGWVALVPLLVAVRRSGPIKAHLLGIGSAVVAATALFYPPTDPEEWGNTGGATIIFSLLLAWVCGFAAASKTGSALRWSLIVAGAGVVGEWMTHLLFPVHLALGQWRNVALMPVASWVGIWGVSFLLYFTNALLAAAFHEAFTGPSRERWRSVRPENRRIVVGALLGLLALHGMGAYFSSRPIPGDRLTVAALQPDDEDPLPLLKEVRKRGALVAVWP